MAKVKINIDEVKSQIKDFDKAVQNLKINLNDFFKALNQYSSWEGEAANKYLGMINVEKINYEDFVQILETFTETLNGVANDLNTSALAAKK